MKTIFTTKICTMLSWKFEQSFNHSGFRGDFLVSWILWSISLKLSCDFYPCHVFEFVRTKESGSGELLHLPIVDFPSWILMVPLEFFRRWLLLKYVLHALLHYCIVGPFVECISSRVSNIFSFFAKSVNSTKLVCQIFFY